MLFDGLRNAPLSTSGRSLPHPHAPTSSLILSSFRPRLGPTQSIAYRKLAHHAPASHESLSLGGEIDNNKRLLSETQISRQLSPGVSFGSSSLRRILEIQIEFEPSLARNPVTVTPSPGLRVFLLHPERIR
jgi:hypothetical protein